jgi:ATP-binding cassette subfamily B protein
LLSLARALVWDPSVLLFDEATSAIDSASETAFRHALEQESSLHRRAILTVAHRLSTARAADRVIVLENGRILETGTPDELVVKGGRFAALLELEAAGWDWQSDPPAHIR